MHTNTAIELLKTLDENEIRRLSDFICSPFFNKRKELIRLFELIIKFNPDYKSNVLKKENLFKKLYAGKAFNEKSLRARMGELSGLIKEFISLSGYQKDNFAQKKYLANELMRKDKLKMSGKILKELLETFGERNADNNYGGKYFEQKYSALTWLSEVNNAEGNYDDALNSEIARGESLIVFFLIEILNNRSEIFTFNINNRKVKDSSMQNKFLSSLSIESFLSYLKESENENYTILAIYYYTYLTRKDNGNEDHYYKLKEIIFKEYKRFSKKELFNFWNFLSGALFPTLVKNNRKFYNEKFLVNKFFSKLDVFLTINEKYIHSQTFTNIFAAAALVKEYKWAEEFILKYKNSLLPDVRENTFNYCLALLYFYKKDHEKSNALLIRIEFSELSYNLDVRICTIMNYYELNLYAPLVSSIDAFKHFVMENKNFPEHRIEWANTSLKFISKIINSKFGNRKLDYADYKEAESIQSFMSRKWVLEKMKELL